MVNFKGVVLLLFLTYPVFGAGVTTDGIQFWAKMDETSGVMTTEFINNATGTLLNGAGFTAGHCNNGVNLDNVNDHVHFNWSDLPAWFKTNQSSITVECWINADDWDANYSEIVRGMQSDGWMAMRVSKFSGIPKVQITTLRLLTSYKNGTQVVSSGTWHQIGFAYDNVNLYFFLDGVYDTPQALTGPIQPYSEMTGLDFGCTYTNESLDGVIDEVRFYSKMLSSDELLNNYNNCTTETPEAPLIRRKKLSRVIENGE